MAAKFGVSQSSYLRWENGTQPNYDTLVAIGKFFKISLDTLLIKKMELADVPPRWEVAQSVSSNEMNEPKNPEKEDTINFRTVAVKQEFFSFEPYVLRENFYKVLKKLEERFFHAPTLSIQITLENESYSGISLYECLLFLKEDLLSIKSLHISLSEATNRLFIIFQTKNDTSGPNGNYNLMLGSVDLNAKAEILLREELKLTALSFDNKVSEMIIEPIFKNRKFQKKKNDCFVLMPFTEKWSDRVWKKIQVIVKNNGFNCKRADNLYGHDVLEDIWTAIYEAQLIIADITNKNPNVFYEIGIAHTLGKKVVLLTQHVDFIPFDFKRYRHIIYEDNSDGFDLLDKELPKYL